MKKFYQNIIILFLVSIVYSCQYFEKNVPAKKDLLNKELKKINFQQVDELPGVTNCDSIDDLAVRKKCFFDFVTISFRNKLLQDSLKLKFPKLDTIPIKVTVDVNSVLNLDADLAKYTAIYQTDKIDSIIKQKLANVVVIQPATKRGVKVKSQFILPIILD